MFESLNPAENTLVECILLGKDAELTAPNNVLRADVLRALILRISDPRVPRRFIFANCPRWVIRGALIDGRLRLRDGRLPAGAPLSALEFVGCHFKGGLNGGGAHFERLRFEDCTFETIPYPQHADNDPGPTPLILCNAKIETELRLKGVRAVDDSHLFWLYAAGLRTGNDVRISDCTFRAPDKESAGPYPKLRFALNLGRAEIDGELMLQPGVRCFGGVALRSARISGDLWAWGLYATDGENEETRAAVPLDSRREAFNAQTATIGGNFSLSSTKYPSAEPYRAEIHGKLHLWGVRVEGNLHLDGLMVQSVPVKSNEGSEGSSVNLAYARIGGDLRMGKTQWGMSAIRFRTTVAWLVRANVRGSVTIDGVVDLLSLDDMVVGGNLVVRGDFVFLSGVGMSVGSDALVWPQMKGLDGESVVDIDVRRTSIRGSLDVSRAQFPDLSDTRHRRLLLRGTEIGKSLILAPYAPTFVSARQISIKCFGEDYSLLEVCFEKPRQTTGERLMWDDEPMAWATFLLYQPDPLSGTAEAAVHFGELISDGRKIPTAFQQIAGRGCAEMLSRKDPDLADYIRFALSFGFDEENDTFSIAEHPEDLPPSMRNCAVSPIEFLGDKEVPVSAAESPIPPGEAVPTTTVKVFHVFVRRGGRIDKLEIHLSSAGIKIANLLQSLPLVDVVETRQYQPPFRFGTDAERHAYGSAGDYAPLSLAEFQKMIPDWRNLLVQPERWYGVKIDLRDSSCTNLRDESGATWYSEPANWRGPRLLLDNFVYRSIAYPNSSRETQNSQEEVQGRLRLLMSPLTDQALDILYALRTVASAAMKSGDQALIDRAVQAQKVQASTEATRLQDIQTAEIISLAKALSPDHLTAREAERIENICQTPGMVNEPFHPQPYQQLAKVWREQGNEEGARQIEKEKIRLESEQRITNRRAAVRLARANIFSNTAIFSSPLKLLKSLGTWLSGKIFSPRSIFGPPVNVLKLLFAWFGSEAARLGTWLWNALYGWGFEYCLSVPRAMFTLGLFYFVGWLGAALLNANGYLTMTTTPVAPQVAQSNGTEHIPVFQKSTDRNPIDSIPCGNSINTLLYAVETATPLLNLHETTRCDIRPPKAEKSIFPGWIDRHFWQSRPSKPRMFEALQAAYEALGYLIWSLAVLTFSGIARRWEQS